ncbi:PREDICTED: mucin-1 [Condylura cristata]|uniref:mucin-1 n=1 Tax=Condylura cristata TaxID=143302 RepID=UPI000643E5BD|nr:PREDICTED: mucin-1 [Condylura cristata]
MTPGTQAPCFLLLLLFLQLTGEGHRVGRGLPSLCALLSLSVDFASWQMEAQESGLQTGPGHSDSSAPTSGPASGSSTSAPPTSDHTTGPASASPTSAPATGPASASPTSAPATGPASGTTTSPGHSDSSAPTSGPASGSSTSAPSTSAPATGPASGTTTSPGHTSPTSAQATGAASGTTTSPGHSDSSAPTSGPALGSTSPGHSGSSAKTSTTPASKGTSPSVPNLYSDSPTTPASHSSRPVASSTSHMVPSQAPSHTPFPTKFSLFFLSFSIVNLQFNSSLEQPSSNYYQKLQRNISEMFLQIYKQDFLGLSGIKFSPGSVVVQSVLIFQEGVTDAYKVKQQLLDNEAEAANYNLTISRVSVQGVSLPSSAQPGSGVPGWGIALLVLICILVALAALYLMGLAVCQCRRRNCGQLDLFPAGDAYHPMSEYPTYHTHAHYVPPGSTRRPCEEVCAGNGGSLSYTNPAATSANL